MKPSSTKGFKELQAQWYARLAEEGFHDAEHPYADRPLKEYHATRNKRSADESARIENYYRLAAQICWDHKFESPVHRLIWIMHAEGFSIREIERQLTRWKRDKINKFIMDIAKAIK